MQHEQTILQLQKIQQIFGKLPQIKTNLLSSVALLLTSLLFLWDCDLYSFGNDLFSDWTIDFRTYILCAPSTKLRYLSDSSSKKTGCMEWRNISIITKVSSSNRR